MMKRYYPNTIMRFNPKSKEQPCYISSYDSCSSMEEALKIIDYRRKEYEVLCAWVDDGEGNILMFENCVNAMGVVDHVFRYTVPGGVTE